MVGLDVGASVGSLDGSNVGSGVSMLVGLLDGMESVMSFDRYSGSDEKDGDTVGSGANNRVFAPCSAPSRRIASITALLKSLPVSSCMS